MMNSRRFNTLNELRHGFLLSGGVFTTIQPLASRDSIARGINNFGQIVGEYTDNNGAAHGFLYNPSNGSFTTLDDPLASFGTSAQGINDLGQIVGFYVDSRLTHHGFLYSGGTYTRSMPRTA
jgi:probable HAF family extracellular repeat protein